MAAPQDGLVAHPVLTMVSGFGSHRREAHIDLLETASTFAVLLQNVEAPAICPKCFHVYARALCSITCESALPYLLAQVHPFWDACARLASHPGADGDLSSLRAALDANLASCHTAYFHAYAHDALRDSASCLMDALCGCLAAALRGGSHKKQHNVFLSKNGMWPSSLDRVMPNGVAPYARWTCMLPTRYPLALLARLTVVARRDLMAGLLQTPSRERVAVTLVRILRRWHPSDSDVPVVVRNLVVHDVPLGRPSVEEATSLLGLAVHFISVFQTGPDRHLDDFPRFAAGFEQPLHDAIIDTVSGSVWKTQVQVDCVVRAASSLCSNGDLPVHPIVRDFRESAEIHQIFSSDLTVGDAAYIYLQQKMDSRYCSGPGCTNYARETDTGRHSLLLCAKCKVMRYCGVECQRLDWTIGTHSSPHKLVCSAIRKFANAGLLDEMGMAAFSAAFFERGFLTDSEFSALGRLALVDDTIPTHIQMGALAKMLGVTVQDLPDELDAAMLLYRRITSRTGVDNAEDDVEAAENDMQADPMDVE